MSVALFGFLLLFTVVAIPMALLVAATERPPATTPAPRAERAGLALVVLCFVIPVIIAALHSAS